MYTKFNFIHFFFAICVKGVLIYSLIILFYQNSVADTSIKKLIGNHQVYFVPIGHTVGNIEQQRQCNVSVIVGNSLMFTDRACLLFCGVN